MTYGARKGIDVVLDLVLHEGYRNITEMIEGQEVSESFSC